jgi:hypothetical protein
MPSKIWIFIVTLQIVNAVYQQSLRDGIVLAGLKTKFAGKHAAFAPIKVAAFGMARRRIRLSGEKPRLPRRRHIPAPFPATPADWKILGKTFLAGVHSYPSISYLGSSAVKSSCGRAMTCAAMSLPNWPTAFAPASTAAVTAATSPLTITVT